MRPLHLAALPLAGAAVALALAGVAPRAVLGAEVAAHVLAAAGCCAAAASLRRGDWLFRAWALYALSHALSAVRRLVPGPGYWSPIGGPFGSAIDSAYVVVVNGARLAGSVLFVLAFARAGLSGAAPSRARGAHAAAVALGLLIGLPTLAAHLQVTLAAGLPGAAFRGSFGVAADVVCFVLVVPLARIAGAFRGGALAAPWAFLAAGNLGWLVFDAARAAARALGLGEAGRAASGAFVVASCLCALAAGLAHRAAVTAPDGAGAPTAGPA